LPPKGKVKALIQADGGDGIHNHARWSAIQVFAWSVQPVPQRESILSQPVRQSLKLLT
jgi:hypothetical protein